MSTLNQIEISKQQPLTGQTTNKPSSLLANKIYRQPKDTTAYIPFDKRVEQCQDLWSLDEDANPSKKTKEKKKEIVSYNANRDKLFIPKPERPKRPIDINKNLIENEAPKVTADLGIQFDKINYINTEKEFLPQKIGKDQGTQILDGELFCFDKDVMPLLTVLVGKTLEQSLNELAQEDEIATLRETKAMYIRKNNEEKKRIRNLEDREIQKKFNNDLKKDKRKNERELRKKTQQSLLSRVISKSHMKNLLHCSINDLISRGQFKNYTNAIVKNETNRKIKLGSEQLSFQFKHLRGYLKHLLKKRYDLKIEMHKDSVSKHQEMLRIKQEEAERIRKENEEKKIQEDIARKERRRQRKIERIKREIKETILNVGVVKGDLYQEEVSEIDNYNKEGGAFISIYGGLIGTLLLSISIVKKKIYQQDTLYNIDNVADILSIYFTDCSGGFPIVFNEAAGEKVKEIREDIDLANMKTNTEIEDEEWDQIGEELSDIKYNADYILKHFLKEFEEEIVSDLYSMFIKAIFRLIQKGNFLDRIAIVFKETEEEEGGDENENDKEEGKEKDKDKDKVKEKEKESVEEKDGKEEGDTQSSFKDQIAKYEAYCEIGMKNTSEDIITDLDFIKKKRGIKVAEFSQELRGVKAYTKVPEHNVLIHDQLVALILRTKMFESTIVVLSSALGTEIDAQPLYRIFNEAYEEVYVNSDIKTYTQYYLYEFEEEKQEEENEQE